MSDLTTKKKLIAYERNGGDMLELVRYQKRNLPKAAGDEYEVLSSVDVIQSEKNRHGELGKYVESISHSISVQNKKSCILIPISGICSNHT